MKKILCFLISAVFAMTMLSSCVTAAAATDGVVVATNGEELYMDIEWDYVIVYIDNIPNYRFWDYRMSRYWYRPVPYDRFRYIHRAPASHRFHNVPMHQHRNWGHQRPGYRPHHDVRPPHRPNNGGMHHIPSTNHRPDVRPNQPRTGGHSSSTRITGGLNHHQGHTQSGHGRFGGRR